MLDPAVEQLWQVYLEAESIFLRSKSMPALERFITALLALPEEEWQAWALAIARLVVDEGQDIPVRTQLFIRVLCPALVKGTLTRMPGCARWLLHFHDWLYRCQEAIGSLPEQLQTSSGLLEEAVKVDPTDTLSRKRFITWCSSYLVYTLHELPSGILYGMNAATATQCEELLQLLSLFSSQVDVTGQRGQYKELIAACAFHFSTYRDYLLAGCSGLSYEAFFLHGSRARQNRW